MPSSRISKGTFLVLIGITIIAVFAVISVMWLHTRNHLQSEHRLLVEGFSRHWETHVENEKLQQRQQIQHLLDSVSERRVLLAGRESLGDIIREVIRNEQFEDLVVVDSNKAPVFKGSSNALIEGVDGPVLKQAMLNGRFTGFFEQGNNGIPVYSAAFPWSIDGRDYWIFSRKTVRSVVASVDFGRSISIGVIQTSENGKPESIYLDNFANSDPAYANMVAKLKELLNRCGDGCFLRANSRVFYCSKLSLMGLNEPVGEIVMIQDSSDSFGPFLISTMIVCMVLLLGPLIFIVLHQRTLNRFSDTVHEFEEHLHVEAREKELAQHKLEEQESMFRNLFEGAPIPMVQINFDVVTERELMSSYKQFGSDSSEDERTEYSPQLVRLLSEGAVAYVNTAAADKFDIRDKEHATPNLRWFLDMLDNDFSHSLIELIAKQRSYSSIECEYFPLRGAKRILLVDFAVLNHRKDRDSILVSFQDITETKREHEALNIAKEQAEEANRMKSSFLANMSHELKTPLNAIIGFSDLLSDSISDDIQREQVRLIRSSGRHLLNIIKDILELTRIETDTRALSFSLFGLQEFLGDFLHPFKAQAESKNLVVEHMTKDSPAAHIFCDQPKLHHVLNNLLLNALKFTEEGGIQVSAGFEIVGACHNLDEQPFSETLIAEIERVVSTEFDDFTQASLCRIWFEVHDSGIGIHPEKLKSMFRPFIQGDHSSTRRYGGAGLGLAVCNKLTEIMGGKLTCQNQKDRGCSFNIEVYGVTSVTGDL